MSNSQPDQPQSTQVGMFELVQPRERLLKYSEPSATGRGLGYINPKYLEPATWEPLLGTEMGRGQYCRFVASMIERIRVKESNFDEIKRFVHLVGTEHNWDFMKLAMPYLPELKEPYPHDTKDFETALLFLLKDKIQRRSIKVIPNAIPPPLTYKDGLNNAEQELLRRTMFGPGAVESPAMSRLFKSTLELGYPQAALHRSMREAEDRGTDIERCSEGLPRNMLMPEADTRPNKFSSSSHSYGAGTPEVWIPNISESNEGIDSPSRELLTELPVDGVDPPLPTPPTKTRMSHGDLPKLSSVQEIEAFGARRAESRNLLHAQPPRMQYRPAEREAVKAYHKEPVGLFLNYFRLLERGTKWPDWPPSPPTRGQSPIAAAPESTQTDTNSMAIPTREQASKTL